MLPAATNFALLASQGDGAARVSGWVGLSPWLLVLGTLLLGGVLACLWIVKQLLSELVEANRRGGGELAELRRDVARWVADREALDLRRIEHVLVDVRDGQQRVEDALLRTVEMAARTAVAPMAPDASPEAAAADGARQSVDALIERVTNRLLALGYERVQVVTEREALAALPLEGRGEILVEARRGGVAHKGRVLLNSGRIADIDMRPPYAMFP